MPNATAMALVHSSRGIDSCVRSRNAVKWATALQDLRLDVHRLSDHLVALRGSRCVDDQVVMGAVVGLASDICRKFFYDRGNS